ncbi:hypothetical protein [Lentzea albidocapillata]|nr:hypothetical protein [Lentzea albidocapillata]
MIALIRLVEITDANRDAVVAVRVHPAQERFVASVEKSFVDARENPEAEPWFRAVYDGDVPVGFVPTGEDGEIILRLDLGSRP